MFKSSPASNNTWTLARACSFSNAYNTIYINEGRKRMCIKGCNLFRLCTKSGFQSLHTQRIEIEK